MGRYCSEKLTKLILISMESNIKYFSDSDLQPFTILATHSYKYDLLSPSFMQTQFKNRLFVLWPRVTSNILYLPEFFQTKQPANEHVRSEISLAALLGASLGSRLREKQPAQQGIVIRQTWRSPQRNLRGLHLWVCFSKKKKEKKKRPLKRAGLPAPLLPWLTAHSRGATQQHMHSDPVWHAWPFPGHTAGLPHPARLKRPHNVMQRQCHRCLAPPRPHSLPSRERARWMPRTATQSERLSTAKQGYDLWIWQWYTIGSPHCTLKWSFLLHVDYCVFITITFLNVEGSFFFFNYDH